MRSEKVLSVEEVQVVGRFESLRDSLLLDRYAQHRNKPLAYWALPTDRRLPLALVRRTLDDLLGTPFAELSAIPGVGQKKILAFLTLLARAAATDPSELAAAEPGNGRSTPAGKPSTNGFDPATVSEVNWAQWRASVAQRGLGSEALGQFAPSLRNVTRVIWDTPLSAYADTTLEQLRSMKTHGQKRVRAILEVFYNLHQLVAEMGHRDHLVVRLVPRLIDGVESWILRTMQTPGLPSVEEIRQHFLSPLLEQIRIDTSAQITDIVENRLGIHGPPIGVRKAAETLGLTRARVYQLLNEAAEVIQVRWPGGRHQVLPLCDKFQAELNGTPDPPNLEQFHTAVELFYPGSRREAVEPLGESDLPAGNNGTSRQRSATAL